MATRPKVPRRWPPHARAALDETLADLAETRQFIRDIRACVKVGQRNIRDPRLLEQALKDIETAAADAQTLLADSEKRLEMSKQGAD